MRSPFLLYVVAVTSFIVLVATLNRSYAQDVKEAANWSYAQVEEVEPADEAAPLAYTSIGSGGTFSGVDQDDANTIGRYTSCIAIGFTITWTTGSGVWSIQATYNCTKDGAYTTWTGRQGGTVQSGSGSSSYTYGVNRGDCIRYTGYTENPAIASLFFTAINGVPSSITATPSYPAPSTPNMGKSGYCLTYFSYWQNVFPGGYINGLDAYGTPAASWVTCST